MTTRRPLLPAAALGLLQAAVSLMWVLGSTWLLATVGPWAVRWSEDSPGQARAALLAITVLKAGLALGPVVTTRWSPRWRVLWWVAGAGVAAYGLLNCAGAWLVVLGLAGDRATTDQAALWGHAALWDPLFLLWGVTLLVGLRATRPITPSIPEPAGAYRA